MIDRSVCIFQYAMHAHDETGSKTSYTLSRRPTCRVRCKLGGKIMFHVEKGSNPNYLAVLVKNVADDGNIVLMELEDKASPGFKPMKQSWGAVWRFDTPKPVKGPFSIRLTSESGKKLVAPNVIPATWKPDTLYNSNIQF